MPLQLISYTLKKRGRSYDDLFETIATLGKWWNCLDSVWIVKTDLTCAQIQERLYPFVDKKDELVVLGLNGNWATCGFDEECRDWLRDNL
jgi:hypothetical protein